MNAVATEYEATFELSNVGMAQVSPDGRFLRVNRRLCELLGYDSGEMVGEHFDRFTHEDDQAVGPAHLALLRQGGADDVAFAKRYRRKDGQSLWVELSVSTVRDAGGGIDYLVTVVQDITARREAEDLLRLEHRVARALNEAGDAVLAVQSVILAVCESQGWQYGRFWRMDDATGVLRPDAHWNVPSAEIDRFVATSRTRSLSPGRGLVGIAWQSTEPMWISDISGDARLLQPDFAHEAGLRAAFVVPVASQSGAFGVLAFASSAIREPDARLVATARSIGSQLGQFLLREKREQALRASEERFRSLTEMSSDGFWAQDEHYRFTEVSGGAFVATDKAGGEIIGKTRWELPRVRPVAGDWGAHRATLEAHEPFHDFLYERTLPDDSVLLVSVSGLPVFDSDGRFSGYRGTATDVTGRRRAEESLRRFRVALDNSADMILLIDRTTMRYIDVNDTVCRLLGYTREEMTAMGPQDVLPESRESLESAYDALIADPAAKGGAHSHYRCKDGATLPFESTRHVLRSGDGYLIAAISRDIRERVAAENSLRESEARFRALTELSSDWYWEQDEHYRFVHGGVASGGKLHVRPAAFVGKTRWDNPTTDLSEAQWAAHRTVLDAREPFSDFEYSRLSANGERRWVSISGAPHFDGGGRFVGYRGVAKDVTEKKRAEAALRESERFAKMTLDALTKSICVLDERGTIVTVNRAWREFAAANEGRPECVLEGVNYLEVCDGAPGTEAALFAEGLRSVLGGGQPKFQMEYACHSPAERRWFHARITRFADDGPVRVVVAHDNITARMLAEEVTRRHARQQGLIAAFGQLALAGTGLAELQDQIVHIAGYGLEVEFCHLLRVAPDGRSVTLKAGTGWNAGWIGRELSDPQKETHFRHVLDSNQPVIVADFAADARLSPSEILDSHGIVSGIEVPVAGATWARASGTLGAFSRERRAFSMEDTDFLQSLVNTLESVAARMRAEEKLAHFAQFDALTELPNRSLFHDRLAQALAHAERNRWLTAVLVVGLDRFKRVNDTLGHATGDTLLKKVGDRLQECVRTGDSVARMSGDEFALILSNLSKADDAGLVAQKVLAACGRPFDLAGQEIRITCSIGVTLAPDDGTDPVELLKSADIALYRAKEQGRDRYQYFLPDMHRRAIERLQTEAALRGALERNEFILHYQPKADLYSGTISGFEALLRWRHPERGLVPPFEFISILEDTGLIVPVGEWVIRTVCEQIMQWRRQGFAPRPVAINLSARQFQQKDLDGVIGAILSRTGVDPRLLEFELTESLLMKDAEEAVRVLRHLKDYGVQLSVDDFGTGYSSLAYLKRFPLDSLKIDRAFIRDCTTDADDATIALSIINLAHSLKLKVVAEGVETEGQLNFLRARGCDQMQGYFFAKPMDAADATSALTRDIRLPRPAADASSGAVSLLLVDDNPDDLEIFRNTLAEDGYTIRTARNPHAALEMMAEDAADIVISDQRMPAMSGVDFLAAVGRLHPHALRVMLTGSDTPDALPDAVNEAHIHKYLSKHWEGERLRLAVREASKRVLARKTAGE